MKTLKTLVVVAVVLALGSSLMAQAATVRPVTSPPLRPVVQDTATAPVATAEYTASSESSGAVHQLSWWGDFVNRVLSWFDRYVDRIQTIRWGPSWCFAKGETYYCVVTGYQVYIGRNR